MRRQTTILLFCACYITMSSADILTSNRLLEDRALYRDLMGSFTCESEGFHQDPNDCTTFYRCIDWGKSDENSVQSRFTSFQFQCGPGTVFEPESSICIHPASSSREECRQYTLPENPEPEPLPPDYDNWANQPESQPSQPAYPLQPSYGGPSNTDYLGSGRPPKPVYVQPESPGQGNPDYGQAPQQPENVDNSVESAPEPPPAQNPNLPKCVAEGFFAIENDCIHFYRCIAKLESEGFIQYQFTCGGGTIFDPDNNVCNYAGVVGRGDCKSEESGAPSSENSPNSGNPSSSAPSGGYNTPAPPNSPSRPDQGPPLSENNEEKPIEFPGATQPPSTPSTPATRPSATYPTRPTGAAGGSQPGYGPQSKPTSTTTSTRPTTTSRTTYPRPSNTGGGGPGYGPPSVTKVPTSSRKPPASASQTKPNNCSSEGFYPIEGDCKRFTRCVDKGNGTFVAYGFDCGEGTVWDTEQNTCNFPESVQRPDCGLTTPRPPPTKAPSNATSTTPSSPSTYPAQTKPVTQGGSYYTTSSLVPTTSKQTTTTSKPPTTAKPYTNKPPYTSPSTTTSSTSRPSYPTRPSNSNNGGNSGYGPSTTTTSTARPTYPTRPSNADAGENSGYGAPSITSEPSPTPGNSSCTSEGYFPVPEDCNKFIRCVSNGNTFTKYEFNCGPGTVWDPKNNVCNHPSAVPNCGQLPDEITSSSSTQAPNSTVTKPTYTTTKSTPQQSTTTKSSTTSKPTSYTTIKPAYTTKPTPTTTTTTKYPTKTTTTSKPDTTKPSSTKKPTNDSTTPKPSKAPSQIKCEKAGFFPHPDDCKKFYRCVDWDGDKGERFSVFYFDCPEGTIFDPALDTCNYEASVYPPRNCSSASTKPQKPGEETSKPCSNSTTAPPSTGTTNAYTTEPTTYKPESTTGAHSTSEYSTESSTYSSTEPNTYGSTESSTYSSTETSESTTYSSTPYESTSESTTYGSTTRESTTESSTYSSTETESSTYSSTPQYTTESSTHSSTEPVTDYYSTESSTATETTTYKPGPVNQTCPDLEENQFAIACPTGFRRHPKFCNMFYQCTISDSNEMKVVSFSCPDNTVFDDSKLQCLSPDQTSACSGDYAKSSALTIDIRSSPGEPDDGSSPPVPVLSKKPLCPSEGNFPYENDCRMLYKCKKESSGKMSGYLFQCPEGYSYWDVSKRCEKNTKTPSCQRGNGIVRKDWKPTIAPVETSNIGY